MNILALECGTEFWGVVLATIDVADENVNDKGCVQTLALALENQPRALARELFSQVEHTLEIAQLSLDDVDALAVGVGPGSWTGLRIGLAAWKTLAQARKLPLAAVPSFDAPARAIRHSRVEKNGDSLLLTVAPSRPGEIYGKIFRYNNDGLQVVCEEQIASPVLWAQSLTELTQVQPLSEPPVLYGQGSEQVAEILAANSQQYSLAKPCREQILLELALAGAHGIAQGKATDPMTLAPLYLAPSNAERNLLQST
jgi:tRNA threonylcarbamoyladenosine biosynthesis protein TsaB